MKTIAILLLSCLSIAASGPPAPPGFRLPSKTQKPAKGAELLTSSALKETAARFIPAAVEPSTNGVITSAVLVDDGPPFGKSLWMNCRQGANTILETKWTLVMQPMPSWNALSIYECWPSEQNFIVIMSGNFQQAYVKGENIPCVPGFAPAGQTPALGVARDLLTPWGTRRVAEVVGVDKPEGARVYKQLP